MRGLLVVTLSAIATLSGCVAPQSRPPAATTPSSETSPTAGVRPTPPETTPSPVEPDQTTSPTAAPPAPPKENAPAAPSKAPAGSSPPKATSSPPGASSTPAKPPVAAAAPAEEPAAAPTLDLPALEERLRDTHAIGVFTKLSLKNQVNDLLDQMRGFHDGQIKVPLAELRQRYEQLLLKVITLLQDSDAQLANAIASSREAIWHVLSDPKTFAKS